MEISKTSGLFAFIIDEARYLGTCPRPFVCQLRKAVLIGLSQLLRAGLEALGKKGTTEQGHLSADDTSAERLLREHSSTVALHCNREIRQRQAL